MIQENNKRTATIISDSEGCELAFLCIINI